nr:SDR family NAD(P)-dependent oxidoreductase [Bacteroidia bacterium]
MKDKIVIITGGSSGIGLACAKRFARAGAKIVITGRDKTKLDAAIAILHNIHSDVFAVVSDVRNFNDCKLIIDETLSRFGRIDVLINNAGISMRGKFEEVHLDVFQTVMNTNFWGTVFCTKLALPHLLKTKGSVGGISSIAGKKGLPGRTAYSASKFA